MSKKNEQSRKKKITSSNRTKKNTNINNVSDMRTKKRKPSQKPSSKRNSKPSNRNSDMLHKTTTTDSPRKKNTVYKKANLDSEYTKKLKEKRKINRQKRRKRKKIQRILFLVGLFLTISIGTFLGIKIYQDTNYPKISYQTVERGVVDNAKLLEGILFRDETVFPSTATGNVQYVIPEGYKVKKNEEVCYVGNNEDIYQTQKEIVDVEEDLYIKQKQRENISYYNGDIKLLNMEISNIINDFYNNRVSNNPVFIQNLRSQLESVVREKTNVYVNDVNDRTRALQEEHQKLNKTLQSNLNYQKATQSGIVSYIVDEDAASFNLQASETIDLKTFKKLYSKNKFNRNMMINKNVKEGEPLFKIISNHKWRLVTFVSLEESIHFDLGKEYGIYLEKESNQKQPFKLIEKKEIGKDVKLIFEATTNISDFAGKRTVEFTVDGNRAEGLKIPLEAMVERNLLVIPSEYVVKKDNKTGVYKKVDNQKVFVPISVEYEKYIDVENKEKGKNSYLLYDFKNLEGLRLEDVLIHPKQENKTLKVDAIETTSGVYVINNKIVTFKEVDLKIKNNDYGIVDEKNSSLKAYDQIISNPTHISENEFLRHMDIQN